jgi:ATP-dependent protease ClpP protease subunit
MFRQPSNLRALRRAWRAAADDVVSRETPCFRVVNAEDDDAAKIYVYDMIGGWDNDAGDFVRALHDITASKIDMHVNSPGGFVYDGVAMYEAVLAHPAHVTTRIDGLAASAASFLALAGDTVEIARAGRMMIHDAQLIAMGSPAELREAADLGDEVSNDIASIYADRAGGTVAGWRKAMSATTYYSSAEAVDAKLADRVSGRDPVANLDNRTRIIQARYRALTTQGG